VVAPGSGGGDALASAITPANKEAHETRPTSREPEAARAVAQLTSALVTDLVSGQSGIAFVYRVLDALVAEYGLHDAAMIVYEHGLGHQVFRASRRLLRDDEIGLLKNEPGIYTNPPLDPGQLDASPLLDLCSLALRLDLLRYDAWHDSLTGLYDRRSFDRLFELSIARTRRYGWRFTLVILDINRFKTLNDRDGHAAGDAALRGLGEQLRRGLRFGDEAARIGGDEFALILPETDAAVIPDLVQRIEGDDEGPMLSLSFGSARCPEEADDFDTLFRLADERLYVAKKELQT
jgi:diguanylate cyclase (GGDEF)-like protein